MTVDTQQSTESGEKADALLSRFDVMRLTGFSWSFIRSLERKGDFPPRRWIGERKFGYLTSEFNAWIKNRPTQPEA